MVEVVSYYLDVKTQCPTQDLDRQIVYRPWRQPRFQPQAQHSEGLQQVPSGHWDGVERDFDDLLVQLIECCAGAIGEYRWMVLVDLVAWVVVGCVPAMLGHCRTAFNCKSEGSPSPLLDVGEEERVLTTDWESIPFRDCPTSCF